MVSKSKADYYVASGNILWFSFLCKLHYLKIVTISLKRVRSILPVEISLRNKL